jgi:hypothetical protein
MSGFAIVVLAMGFAIVLLALKSTHAGHRRAALMRRRSQEA